MSARPPEEIGREIRQIGRIRVGRYQRWAFRLLLNHADPALIVERLLAKGFSPDLAEWIVFSMHDEVEQYRQKEEELPDLEEPGVFEMLVRVLFSATFLWLLVVLAAWLQRFQSLAASVIGVPLLMLGALAALAYLAFALADLWERWRTRGRT